MCIFEKAQIDFLTGFFMRESFGPFLEKAIREANAAKGVITVALVDLDKFKKYNDKFGHDFGDEILKYAASTIRLTMDENQTYFFRYGGDEFIVVFVGKTPKEVYHLLRTCRNNLLKRPFRRVRPDCLKSSVAELRAAGSDSGIEGSRIHRNERRAQLFS